MSEALVATDVEVIVLDTQSLGDRSYLVTDGEVAVAIDPQRDIDRITAILDERGIRLTHVCETHIHNDYVTGGLELASATGAAYMVSAADTVDYDREPVSDGDTFTAGALHFRAMATPGHTPHHMSYVLEDDGANALHVFSGGSLLFGGVGRPDLISEEMTPILVREQYRSVRRLADAVGDHTELQPTHGFGSHCASGSMDDIVLRGTVGGERERNSALSMDDEDAWVEEVLAGLHPWPAYYAHMGPLNAKGPAPLDLSAPRLFDRAALKAALEDGAWLVDLRERRAYARDHVRGTVNVELRNDLPTYLGWIIPWDVSMILLGATADDVAEAQRMLARIGLDHPQGMAVGSPEDWADEADRTSHSTINFMELKELDDESTIILDVRDLWEWDDSHHPKAFHIPFYEIEKRADELPDHGTVHVYCATSNRAAVAVSLLARMGRDVVLIDDFCLPGDTPWD